MNKQIEALNELLGQQLGRNILGESVFSWAWSEDLLWPATATGRNTTRDVEVPIIGGGTDTAQIVTPEYVQQKQCAKYNNQWLVSKWCAPETLSMWHVNFPGAPYPTRGYRIHTNATLAPFCEPTLADTEAFIVCMKEQRSMTMKQRLQDMEADRDRKETAKNNLIYDEVRDLVPAFANYQPGKRGAYVSLPTTKIDKMKDGSNV